MLLLQISKRDIKVRNVQLANVFICEGIVTRTETKHFLLIALFWWSKVHVFLNFRFLMLDILLQLCFPFFRYFFFCFYGFIIWFTRKIVELQLRYFCCFHWTRPTSFSQETFCICAGECCNSFRNKGRLIELVIGVPYSWICSSI